MKTSKSWMFAAILFCGTSMSAQAQDYYETKNEISVSIGSGTNTQIINAFSEMFSVMGEALITGTMTGGKYVGTTTYGDESYFPPISVEYFRHLNKLVSIGGIAAFNGYSRDMYCNWQDTETGRKTEEKIGKGKKYFATVMPAVKFDWLRKKNFGLYSKAAIGLTYMYEKQVQNEGDKKVHDDKDFMLNFQASLLGVEAGSEKVRGFAEFGFGEQGILQAGIRYKF